MILCYNFFGKQKSFICELNDFFWVDLGSIKFEAKKAEKFHLWAKRFFVGCLGSIKFEVKKAEKFHLWVKRFFVGCFGFDKI